MKIIKIIPKNLSAAKTDHGIRLTSQQEDNAFSIELIGKEIKPLLPDRLVWQIDGHEIELLTAFVSTDNANIVSDLEQLQMYQKADVLDWHEQGWTKTAEEVFQTSDGQVCLYWQMEPNGEKSASSLSRDCRQRLVVSTINQAYVVVLIGLASTEREEQEVKAYLQSTVQLLQRESSAEVRNPVNSATEQVNPMMVGASLAQGLWMTEALFGEKYGALLNKHLMTEEDRLLPNTVWFEPSLLLKCIRYCLDNDLEGVLATVFDGASAHTIILEDFNTTTETYVYLDPWGQGSFLEARNNAAGINALQHPTESRSWLLKSEELERVIYAFTLSETELIKLLQWLESQTPVDFCTLGFLQQRLEEVQQSDLFTFFNLEQVDVSKIAPDQSVISFQPSGSAFRDLVMLQIMVDRSDRIQQMDLILARSFVNDPKNTIFARDFAKSFFLSVVPQVDASKIAPLVNAIFLFDTDMLACAAKFPANLSTAPLNAYLTFLGLRQQHEQKFSLCKLILENISDGKMEALHISVSTQP